MVEKEIERLKEGLRLIKNNTDDNLVITLCNVYLSDVNNRVSNESNVD